MVYSLNFWIAFVVDVLLFAFILLSFASIYRFVDDINGWTLNQMFIFVGTFHIVDSVAMATYFFGLLYLPGKIQTGSLDIMLVKPVDTQFYVSSDSFNPGSFLGVLSGAAMVTYGLSQGGYTVTGAQLAGYLLLLILMSSLMYSLFLLVRIFAFFFVKIDALTQAQDSAVDFAFRIPGTAFKGISKVVFMLIIPYGLIATVPTEFITNMLAPEQWATVIGITLFFGLFSRLFFKFGLGRYSSASS